MKMNVHKGYLVTGVAIVIIIGYAISSHFWDGSPPIVLTIPAEVKVWWDPNVGEKMLQKTVQDEAKARSVVKLATSLPGCPTGGGLLPEAEELDKLDHDVLRTIYHDFLSNSEVVCNVMVRMGKLGDGGWEVCNDENVRPKEKCLIYSFGIAFDFSFDDMVAHRFGCEVHAFDPSMKVGDVARGQRVTFHNLGISGSDGYIQLNWPVKTLTSIRQMLGHTGRRIDVLKMDVEGSEWDTLTIAAEDGSLKNVSQFLFETHLHGDSRSLLLERLKVLKKVRDLGFRTFYAHKNSNCPWGDKASAPQRTACHEVHMLYIPACAKRV